MSQKGRQERVRMRSVRRWPLGGNLPTSLSIPLEISPYRRGRYNQRTRKGSGHINRNRDRDCHDFRKEGILAQMRDVLEFPREIRHQSIVLFAGRVLEQPTNILTKFVSLRKQSVVLGSSRHGTTESKRNEIRQIYIHIKMTHRRDYSCGTRQALCLTV